MSFRPASSLASIRTGVTTLLTYPLRTLLSTLGVIIGVAALVAVLALGDGIEHYARAQIEQTTSIQSLVVSPRTSEVLAGQRFARQDYLRFSPADVPELDSLLGGRAYATLLLDGAVRGDSAAGQPSVIGVVGTLPATFALQASRTSHGRFFTWEETRSEAPVGVLSSALASSLAGSAPVAGLLGNQVVLGGVPVAIVGIARDSLPMPTLVVPLGLAPRLLPPSSVDRAPNLLVRAGRVEDVAEVQQVVEEWLKARDPEWRRKAELQTAGGRIRQAEQGMLVFKLSLGAITGISLLVGGIGIMNVLLASVVERTREIGIRKAIGARHHDIMLQFLTEAVTVAGAGSLAGVVLGLAGAFGITALIRAQSQAELYAGFSWTTVLVAGLAATSVGLVFGLYPAVRAARLSPIDAIRHE